MNSLWKFNDLNQVIVRAYSGEYEAGFLQSLKIFIIEFIPMSMSLADGPGVVQRSDKRIFLQYATVRTEAHRIAIILCCHVFLLHFVDMYDRMRSLRIDLDGVCLHNSCNIACEFNCR